MYNWKFHHRYYHYARFRYNGWVISRIYMEPDEVHRFDLNYKPDWHKEKHSLHVSIFDPEILKNIPKPVRCKFLQYRGIEGTAEYNEDEDFWFGTLNNIKSETSFTCRKEDEVKHEFEATVDMYLDMMGEM